MQRNLLPFDLHDVWLFVALLPLLLRKKKTMTKKTGKNSNESKQT
jgi:hypothetical protein